MIPLSDQSLVLDEMFLTDHSPSSAVEHTEYDHQLGVVRITFHNPPQTYSVPCSLRQWLQYKSADSKGSAVNTIFGITGGRR